MNAALTPAQIRLEAIRGRVGLASASWELAGTDVIEMLAGDETGHAPVAIFAAGGMFADQDFLSHAPDDLRWLLGRYDALADRYRAALREIDRLTPKPKDFAAECAMKCEDPLFRQFLAAEHDIDATDRERIATRLRTVLQITSRAELNTDEAARKRWLALRDRFDRWRKRR